MNQITAKVYIYNLCDITRKEINNFNSNSIIVFTTNERLILNQDLHLKLQYSNTIQEYLKEHYLEGCKFGKIKLTPSFSQNLNIQYIFISERKKSDIYTRDLNDYIHMYIKIFSTVSFLGVENLYLTSKNNFMTFIILSAIKLYNLTFKVNFTINIYTIYDETEYASHSKGWSLFNDFDSIYVYMEQDIIIEIYTKTYLELSKLHEYNVDSRHENYPIIKPFKSDILILEYYLNKTNDMNLLPSIIIE